MIFFGVCCWFNSSLGAHFCYKYLSVYLIAVCSCSIESHPGSRAENRTLKWVYCIPKYSQQPGQVLSSSLTGSVGGRDGVLLRSAGSNQLISSLRHTLPSSPSRFTPRNDVRSLQISGWPEAAPQVQEAINIRCGQGEKGRQGVLNDL